MFLKLKEFGGISFLPEESVSLSIVYVGPYLVGLVCIPPFIDYVRMFARHTLDVQPSVFDYDCPSQTASTCDGFQPISSSPLPVVE